MLRNVTRISQQPYQFRVVISQDSLPGHFLLLLVFSPGSILICEIIELCPKSLLSHGLLSEGGVGQYHEHVTDPGCSNYQAAISYTGLLC